MEPLHALYGAPPENAEPWMGNPVNYLGPCGMPSTLNEPQQVIEANYLDLASIKRISKFRSGTGHDYSDDFESCSSMKHYFEPYSNVDWASLVVRAPVSGVVVLSAPESIINGKPSGNQVWIASEADPFLQVVLFHVTLLPEIERGTAVTAGQQIGTHIGTVTTSDIAVQQVSEQGLRYVSAFDVLTEQAFSEFQSRGIADRQAPQITADYRLAHRLTCQGEEFVGANDNPADWITLN